MKAAAFIQARLGSTRLPEKVMLGLEGRTVLERVIERVAASRFVDEVIVVTTIHRQDMNIVKRCVENGVRVFCGSEDDVLDRFYQAAKLLNLENLVRITADCPLMDPEVIDQVLRRHFDSGADYTANVLEESFPDGEDVEVMRFTALKKAWEEADLLSEREHVTPYIRKHPEMFRFESVRCERDYSKLRWTLDNKEDYEVIKNVYAALYHENNLFGMNEILNYLESNPEDFAANKRIVRNEGYQKSLGHDKILNI